VASSAGGTLFHLGHGKAEVVRPGGIGLVMTIITGVNRQMPVVIETGIMREEHFFDGMALAALLDSKCGFAVMAGAARHSLIHFSHAETS